jgi:hypothetical protein
MIIFTASDSSEGEEKNPDLSKEMHWFDLPSTCIPSGSRERAGNSE